MQYASAGPFGASFVWGKEKMKYPRAWVGTSESCHRGGRLPWWASACPLVIVSLLLVNGCGSTHPSRAPDVIVEDAHSGGSAVALASGAPILASGGWEGRIRVYALPGGGGIGSWQAHGGSVNGLAFTNGAERLVSAGFDGRVVEWSAEGRALRSRDTGRPVLHMVLDEAADRMVTGHADGSVMLWRLSDWTPLEVRRVHAAAVRAVAYHGATGRVASSSRDGSVSVWRQDGPLRQLSEPPTDAWSLLFSADGALLFGGGWFDLFRWRLSDGGLTVLDTDHSGIIKSLDLAPDGRALASISRQTDSAVYFLDPESGATVARFRRHDLCGAAIAVSADGRYMATTSDDASVRIWRLEGPPGAGP